MKKTYLRAQLWLLVHQLLLSALLCYEFYIQADFGLDSVMPLTVITLTSACALLIELQNIQCNTFLAHYAGVLIFTTWVLLFLRIPVAAFETAGLLLYAILPVVLTRFLLTFVFQDTTYTGRRLLLILQLALSLLTVLSFAQIQLFNLLLACQWMLSFMGLAVILLVNRKRSAYFFKQEGPRLLRSLVLICLPLALYIFIFRDESVFLSNVGLYVIIGLPLASVHTVIKASRRQIRPVFLPLSLTAAWALALVGTGLLFAAGWYLKLPVVAVFILLHLALLLMLVCFLLICLQFGKNAAKTETCPPLYQDPLIWLSREETLKKDFSNYLHDAVLQDLLSVKNLIPKADQPAVKSLILDTLNNLSTSIRGEMQDYSPALLRSLTLKENFQRLLEGVGERYPAKNIQLVFKCPDDFFLIEPYNRIVYRLLRELANNAYKHSGATVLTITLALEEDTIHLCVKDNGTGLKPLSADGLNHKGLSSIADTVRISGGTFNLQPASPTGLAADIHLPVKGDLSYEHFTDR